MGAATMAKMVIGGHAVLSVAVAARLYNSENEVVPDSRRPNYRAVDRRRRELRLLQWTEVMAAVLFSSAQLSATCMRFWN